MIMQRSTAVILDQNTGTIGIERQKTCAFKPSATRESALMSSGLIHAESLDEIRRVHLTTPQETAADLPNVTPTQKAGLVSQIFRMSIWVA